MEKGEYSVALIMDQSLAYDLVDHHIIKKKLKSIGLDQHSLQLLDSYLQDQQQAVQVESFTSPLLHIGPRSVIQGSALSCILYIIFTLDLPLIFTENSISVHKEELSKEPKSTTYINDNIAVQKAEDYMINNRGKKPWSSLENLPVEQKYG